MNYILTTQVTKDYYERARPLFESVFEHWPHRFLIGCIGFVPDDYTPDTHYFVSIKNVATYRNDYPRNRDDFVCMQGGEFIDYLNCDDDDLVIEIDADNIMQRPFTADELAAIVPERNQIIATYPANPPQSLHTVWKNLRFKMNRSYTDLLYGVNDRPEFCGAFLVARATTWRRLRGFVVNYFDTMVAANARGHHAGIQLLISAIAWRHFNVRVVGNHYQVGQWYKRFNTSVEDDKLLLDGEVVIFNHNKFNVLE